jgi:hypothetical protein
MIVSEVTLVPAPVLPNVDAPSVRMIRCEIALVAIAFSGRVNAAPRFLIRGFLPLVSITVRKGIDTIAIALSPVYFA